MALSERRAWRSETYLFHNGTQAVLSFILLMHEARHFHLICVLTDRMVYVLWRALKTIVTPVSRSLLHPLIPLPTNFSQISALLSFEVDRKFLIDSFMLSFLLSFFIILFPHVLHGFMIIVEVLEIFFSSSFSAFMVKVLFYFVFLYPPSPLFFKAPSVYCLKIDYILKPSFIDKKVD